MKKQNITKAAAGAILMSTALCFSACGAGTKETPNTSISEDSESDETGGQEDDDAEGNTTAEDESLMDNSEDGAENDTHVNNTGSSVTVVMKKGDDVSMSTDDGTVFYTITCSYPVVSIAGNDAAAEKINENILARVESFNSATNESIEYAKEDFEYMLSEDIQPPMPYSSDLSYFVTRADDNVISFTEGSYEYLGGAHGMPYTTGINYDAKTGELLSFADLSDDLDTFHAKTLAYNQTLARTEYYSDQLFNTDDITNGRLEEVLYADGMWFLSTSGLVFMSPPYELAPYASGTMEFTIPYNDLENMGLKEAYAYTGRQIIKVMEDEPYSIDLNGDGNEESVVSSTEWVDDGSGDLTYLTHLTVNGVDFSQQGTEDVVEQLVGPWPDLCIYDLDDSDQYLDLALLYTEWTQAGDDYITTKYSRLFRYTEDGTLVYLGQANGDVSDPSVSVSAADLKKNP